MPELARSLVRGQKFAGAPGMNNGLIFEAWDHAGYAMCQSFPDTSGYKRGFQTLVTRDTEIFPLFDKDSHELASPYPTAPKLVRVQGGLVMVNDLAIDNDGGMWLVVDADPTNGISVMHPTRGIEYHLSTSAFAIGGFWRTVNV